MLILSSICLQKQKLIQKNAQTDVEGCKYIQEGSENNQDHTNRQTIEFLAKMVDHETYRCIDEKYTEERRYT